MIREINSAIAVLTLLTLGNSNELDCSRLIAKFVVKKISG